jgi:chemotaxis protein MotB
LDAEQASDLSLQFGKKGIIVQLTNRITFEEGRAVLRPEARRLLSEVGQLFADTLGSISVIGHSSLGGYKKGEFPDDWTLSFARAGVAARYFISSSGVKPKRITTAGYGSTRPRTSGDTERKRILNDRLELILDRTKI